jgi:hypothetical protein
MPGRRHSNSGQTKKFRIVPKKKYAHSAVGGFICATKIAAQITHAE